MRHDFSNADIGRAGASAALKGGVAPSPVSTVFLKRFLDHLPESDDDWQECGFNDFLPTDKRVKAVFAGGSIIEGTPDRRNHEHVFLVDGPVIHSYDDATFYRIPAPVQHPDPAEHPVIIVDTNYGGLKGRHPFVWDGEIYAAVSGPIKHANPETITDWEPADIVPKVVEDDR